jgi:hypothetical protein
MTTKRPYVLAGAVLISLGLAGCGSSDPTGPTAAAPSPTSPGTSSGAASILGAQLAAALEADLQDEYRAEAIYGRVLADFGNVLPFANIIRAERQHAASVVGLYTSRGLTPPASVWNVDNVPRFASLREACAGGVEAETLNIGLYDSQLSLSLPDDVRRVLQANRDASLFAHLPAFERCR